MAESETLIVIYDAGCGFCSAVAHWLTRHDRRARIALVPIADVVAARGHRLTRRDLDVEMHVLDKDGRLYRGYRAWRRIAREIPIVLPVWPALWLPGVAPAGDVVYRWVAAHRAWLSRVLGLTSECNSSGR